MNRIEDNIPIQKIFDKSEVGVAVVSPEGKWLRVNSYLCEMLGYEEEELLALTFQAVTHPKDLASEQPYLAQLTAGSIQHYQFRKRYIHKTGKIVWGVLDRTVFRDAKNKPTYFISRIRDITAEKAAEQKPTIFSKLTKVIRGFLQRR